MPKTHPDAKSLEKFSRGKLPRRDNLKVAWHLFNCAACRSQVEEMSPGVLESLFSGLEPQDVADNPSYERAFSYGQSALEVRGEARERDRHRAPKLFGELMRHPVSRQRSLIQRTWRFKNYVFAEYLLQQSHQALFDDPARAEDLADLSLVVAEQLVGSHYGPALVNDLKARAWAYIGNARRVDTDFRSAEEALATAVELAEKGSGDPLLEARLSTFDGALARERRNFDQAHEKLQQALEIYREAGEDHWVGRTLLSLGTLHRASGNPKKGVAVLNEAIELIDYEREPRLELVAKVGLVASLVESRKFQQAAEVMPEVKGLIDQGNSLDPLRVRWLEGSIALGLGELDEAEKIFVEIRDAFVQRGIGYEAALVSLDLATVYSKQRRTGEMKQLAEEMLPIFRSRDVHREALAALIVFQKAAQAEKVSMKMLKEITSYLQQARNNPELRYQQAS